MTSNLAETLEQCLSQIESGRARVESCLVSYPALAVELKPLLCTAQALRAAPRPEPSPEAVARIAAVAFGHTSPVTRSATRPVRTRRPLFSRPWAFAALGTLIIAMVLSGTGLAYGATGALPGSALYPAKLATEAVWLWVVPEREEGALHLRLAGRRLAEIEILAGEGIVEPQVLEAMARHVEIAYASAQAMPEESGLPLMQAILELNDRQEQALTGLMDQVPEQARVHLGYALQLCIERGRHARGVLKVWQTPPPGENGAVTPSDKTLPTGPEASEPAPQVPSEEQQEPPAQDEPGQDKEPVQDKEGEMAEEEEQEEAEEEQEEAAEEEQEEAEEEQEEAEEEQEEAAEEEQEEAEEEQEEAAEEEQEEAEEEQEEAEEEQEEAAEEEQEEAEEEQEEAEEEQEEAEEEQEEAAEEEQEEAEEEKEEDKEEKEEEKEEDKEEKEDEKEEDEEEKEEDEEEKEEDEEEKEDEEDEEDKDKDKDKG